MKNIALMALFIGSLRGLSAATVCTSTGNGNWSTSFNSVGSGTPLKYIIRAQDTITVDVSGTSAIDTLDIYGELSFNNARKLDIATTGIIMLRTGGSIRGGNGGSKFDFGTGIDIIGPFSVTGPAYAKSNSGGFILGAIPVTWLDFTVEAAGKNIRIQWKTASEQNTAEFELLIGWDGLHWTALYTTPAAGNSNTLREYNYLHMNPGSSVHFYRVKQKDQNGSFTYSDSRFLLLNERGTPVCSPNPVTDFLYIQVPTGATLKNISVYNLSGIQMPAGYDFLGDCRVNMQGLDAGMYVVQILMEDGTLEVFRVMHS